jgi:hypothetical protein
MMKRFYSVLAFAMILCLSGQAFGQETDESALFSSVAPDAMIVLDLSGSMRWNPAGDSDRIYGNSTCSGTTFYDDNNNSGYTTLCTRYAIARRSVFSILDDDGNGKINADDEVSLNIRFGLGKFQGSTYSKIRDIKSKYSKIYCGADISCTIGQSASGTSNIRYWADWDEVTGATPLVTSLSAVKTYLDAHKLTDTYASCRQKFVILISDGADTMACSGSGSETQSDMYKRRRNSVMAAKALADAGYRVFVIGMGSTMPDHLKNTLNWMAYYGGTDNPIVPNSGDETAFDPSLVTSCGSSSTTGTCNGTSDQCFAVSNDPGNLSLAGHAFIANDAAELDAAFRQAISVIRDANYSFSQASVASSRLVDENYIYEASFQPVNAESFWIGHLKKFQILGTGAIGSVLWDAGAVLQSTDAASRTIYTYKSGALTPFTTSNITYQDLNVADNTRRNEVVGFIRGESTYNKENWKLGDTFRSNPITVGTPSTYYKDYRDSASAFAAFRVNNPRTTANGKRIVVSGANDGQLHAFRADTGAEVWSFIPPNQLYKLKDIAHKSHPTGLSHQYYIDGPISVADVWLGTGDGTTKSPSDWKTVLVFGEGRGAIGALWSSSASCMSDFQNVYSATYSYYCGYFALDITNTYSPIFKWSLSPSSAEAPYLGEPWSKMMVHRVKVSGNEKWVGFIGGGHSLSTCSGTDCDKRGKGFFVVNLTDGTVLWSVTGATNSDMTYGMPGTPATVDLDNDGFTDLVYMGDLGGNMWRFRFCTMADGASCNTSNWSVSRLFQRDAGAGSVYDAPSVTKDAEGHVWVYWGTGNKSDPIVVTAGLTDRFYGVKDATVSGGYTLSDLENIDSTTYTDNATKRGWYFNLAGSGEKCLADSSIFAGEVYFTTYTPGGSDPCSDGGTAKIYAISYITGAGSLTGNRSQLINGTGIPTAPILSMNPYTNRPDLYLTISGAFGTGYSTEKSPINPPSIANRTNIIHWRDRRVQ